MEVELDKEFTRGPMLLHVIFTATVYKNGDVEDHRATIEGHDITECFSLLELQGMNEEFRKAYYG